MTLQQAIEAVQDPDVAIDDALRRVLTIGIRIRSDPLKDWTRAELFGYKSDNDVPDYRRAMPSNLRIRLHFSGMYGREGTHTLGYYDLPEDLRFGYENGHAFLQPAKSLEEMSKSNVGSVIPLPGFWVVKYNGLGGEAPVVFPFASVVGAELLVDKALFVDLISATRTFALELLLGVESVDLRAGEAGGPTVEQSEELREAVEMHITEIHGPITVNYGDGNVIGITHATGDLTIIESEAEKYIAPDEVAILIAALKADGGTPGKNTKKFLDRVKAGSVALASNMLAAGAYEGLTALLGIF